MILPSTYKGRPEAVMFRARREAGRGKAKKGGRDVEGTMKCFLCGEPASAHVIRSLKSTKGPRGWARLCVPCAIRHDIDGALLAGPLDRELAERWRAHRKENG